MLFLYQCRVDILKGVAGITMQSLRRCLRDAPPVHRGNTKKAKGLN